MHGHCVFWVFFRNFWISGASQPMSSEFGKPLHARFAWSEWHLMRPGTRLVATFPATVCSHFEVSLLQVSKPESSGPNGWAVPGHWADAPDGMVKPITNAWKQVPRHADP